MISARITQVRDYGNPTNQDLIYQMLADETLDLAPNGSNENRNEASQHRAVSRATTRSLFPNLLDNAQTMRRSIAVNCSTHACAADCRCAFHHRQHLRSLLMLDKLTGSIFVNFVGLPVFSPPCNLSSCALRVPGI